MTTSHPGTDPAPLRKELLAALGSLDRRLWGSAIARAVERPQGHLYQQLPRRGPAGAAYDLVCRFWGRLVLVAALSIPAEFVPESATRDWLLAAVWLLAGAAMVVTASRGARATALTKAWQQTREESDAPANSREQPGSSA